MKSILLTGKKMGKYLKRWPTGNDRVKSDVKAFVHTKQLNEDEYR